MTISIRNDWYGNAPVVTFECVERAVDYIQANPSYEIVPESNVRLYGDIDGSTDNFYDNDLTILISLMRVFESVGERVVIYTSSSAELKKHSFRWILPNRYCNSRKEARIFAEKLYSQLELPEGVKGDVSVYSSGRKMRCVGTSKPNENRPLFLLFETDSIEDTLISYIPVGAKKIDIEIPVERRTTQAFEPTDEVELLRICDAISIERWTDYSTCMRLVFAMCSAGASADTIHTYCAKASNYGPKWVDGLLKSWNPTHSPTIATLIYYAKIDSPSFKPTQTSRNTFQELTQLTTNDDTLFNHHTHKGFLKELPIHPTQAVKSHMGTGKSTEMKRIIKESKSKHVLVISSRCTWTSSFKEELGFEDYREFKTKHIEPCNLICQVQSLHRLKDNQYDLVFLDESETVCATLSPNLTHQKKYHENVSVFESVIRSAKRVIALDAFLSDRTVRLLDDLRGNVQIIINPKHPFNKTAKLFRSYQEYIDTLQHRLKNGKRIISFWGARDNAERFHSLHNHGVLYTGHSDEKLKTQHFSNPNLYWSTIQHVSYTSTVTVGINYTAKPEFDQASFYVTAFSSLPRDAIQALHRARSLKDDVMFGFIKTDCPPAYHEILTGIEEQEVLFNEISDRKHALLEALGEKPVEYSKLPNWLRKLLIWNRNEVVTSKKHFEEVFLGYLELCGVTSSIVGEKDKKTQSKTEKTFPDVSTIREITSNEEADTYIKNRKELTKEQNYELELYFLKDKVDYVDQTIWELWLTNRRWIDRTFHQVNSTASFQLQSNHNPYIELIPTDIERLHVVHSFNFDFNSSWTIPVEELKQISLDCFHLRNRTDKDTPEQYARDVSKAFKDWNGTELKVERKQSTKNKEYIERFFLSYSKENPIYKAISRNFKFE